MCTKPPVSLLPEQQAMQAGGGAADPSGALTLFDVPPGRYQVRVHLMLDEGYVQSITFGGHQFDGNWIEVGPEGAAGKVEVLVAFDGGEVGGTVENPERDPLPGAMVHLLEDPRLELRKSTRSDQDGRFRFRHIAPGDYWIFALESLQPGVPLEQRWEQHEGFAGKITVRSNSTQELLARLP